jgi:hypothetical protein
MPGTKCVVCGAKPRCKGSTAQPETNVAGGIDLSFCSNVVVFFVVVAVMVDLCVLCVRITVRMACFTD